MKTRHTHQQKVAICIDNLYGGGAEKVMLTLASGLAKLGHQAHFFIFDNVIEHEIPEEVSVHQVYAEPVNVSAFFGAKKHAKALQIKVSQIEQSIGKFDLFLSNLDKTNYIISHCDFSPCYYVVHNAIQPTLARAKKMGPIKYLAQALAFRALSNKDLICVSRGLEQEIEQLSWIVPRSLQTIYNPIDVDEIESASAEVATDLPEQDYFVHVGRAAKQKRHDVLFRAFKVFLSKHPSYTLVCLAKNTKKLRKLAKKYGVERNTRLLGFKKNPYPYIKGAKALVLSSDFEGFGAVLVESIICGTLPISTQCPHGPDEILLGSLQEFLVPVNDVQSLADTMANATQQNHGFNKGPEIQQLLQSVHPHRAAQAYLDLIDGIRTAQATSI